jgi:hypothetical protein
VHAQHVLHGLGGDADLLADDAFAIADPPGQRRQRDGISGVTVRRSRSAV